MSFVPAALALYDGPGYVAKYLVPAFDLAVTQVKALPLPPVAMQVVESFLRVTPFHCMLMAVFITYACHIAGVFFTLLGSGGYDNVDGRSYTKKFQEKGGFAAKVSACASAAHQNGFETLLIFSAGVLSCVAVKVEMGLVAKLSQLFVVFRALFSLIYIVQPFFGPLATLVSLGRSGSWMGSIFTACCLISLAAEKASL
mmetsp:Transcript_78524/g.169692  ORF Transcript_78524/g.169692 Transcript_78524/m.169692 type:complete len:199 (+) Transcript_78524:65-661(+)